MKRIRHTDYNKLSVSTLSITSRAFILSMSKYIARRVGVWCLLTPLNSVFLLLVGEWLLLLLSLLAGTSWLKCIKFWLLLIPGVNFHLLTSWSIFLSSCESSGAYFFSVCSYLGAYFLSSCERSDSEGKVYLFYRK